MEAIVAAAGPVVVNYPNGVLGQKKDVFPLGPTWTRGLATTGTRDRVRQPRVQCFHGKNSGQEQTLQSSLQCKLNQAISETSMTNDKFGIFFFFFNLLEFSGINPIETVGNIAVRFCGVIKEFRVKI